MRPNIILDQRRSVQKKPNKISITRLLTGYFLYAIIKEQLLFFLMVTKVNGINLGTIREKYPNFEIEYTKNWRAIIKKRLATLSASASSTTRLTGVKQECAQSFPYLNDDELRVVQDRISSMFRSSIGHPDWDPWRSQLHGIFKDVEIENERLVTIFQTTTDGEPVSVSKPISTKEQTFTVSVVSDNGGQVFQWSGVPKDLAMTSISELTRALA